MDWAKPSDDDVALHKQVEAAKDQVEPIRLYEEGARPAPQWATTRYPALRSISAIYRIASVLIAVSAVIYGIVGLVGVTKYEGLLLGCVTLLGTLLVGGLAAVTTLAISEGIRLFIDIEANTRRAQEEGLCAS